MADVNTLILTLSVMVALSGWAKFFYDMFTNKPKIDGRVFNVIIGIMPHPNIPNKTLTSFLVYLYLTNKRKNSAHILNYELEIDLGEGFKEVDRVYGIQNVQNWGFSSQTHSIDIPNLAEKLIYSKVKPVEYGSINQGFVLFASPKPQSDFINAGKAVTYKVTCLDVFGNRHKIVSSPDKFMNLFLLQDMAGIKLTPLRNE